jgi:putative membrane protein
MNGLWPGRSHEQWGTVSRAVAAEGLAAQPGIGATSSDDNDKAIKAPARATRTEANRRAALPAKARCARVGLQVDAMRFDMSWIVPAGSRACIPRPGGHPVHSAHYITLEPSVRGPRYSSVMKILVRWLLLAAALLLVAHLYPGVVVDSFGSAMIAAFVIGLLNTLLRPILVLLTLPVTLITLGLFLFVINALMFYFAASMLNGLHVTGFTAALIGSLIYSLCGMVIDVAMERLFKA